MAISESNRERVSDAYFEYLTIGAATVTNLSDKSRSSGLLYVIFSIEPLGEI